MAVKTYVKVVTVRGATLFPVDMLRYDRAWPRTEQDSLKIMGTWDGERYSSQEVELHMRDMPNRERWASFGWEVVRTERGV